MSVRMPKIAKILGTVHFHRPRVANFYEMLEEDDTRPTESWNGVWLSGLGFWMLTVFVPAEAATAFYLWKYVGPTVQGVALMTLGVLQFFGAFTKWAELRKTIATVAAGVMMYFIVCYTYTNAASWVTWFLFVLWTKEIWVAWRIWFDKEVNGSERRRKRCQHAVV